MGARSEQQGGSRVVGWDLISTLCPSPFSLPAAGCSRAGKAPAGPSDCDNLENRNQAGAPGTGGSYASPALRKLVPGFCGGRIEFQGNG